MLEQFCYVLNPKLKLEAKEKTAEISFYGCKNATIHSLNVKRVFQSKPGEALS